MLEAKRFLPQFLRNVSLSVVDKQFEQAYVAYVTANSMNHSSCSIWLLPDCQGRGGDIFFTQMHQPVHCPGRFELLHMVCNFWIGQGRKSLFKMKDIRLLCHMCGRYIPKGGVQKRRKNMGGVSPAKKTKNRCFLVYNCCLKPFPV